MFVKLSHWGSGKTIFINPELVTTVEPEIDGSTVRANNFSIRVEQKYKEVLELLHGTQQRGEENGEKNF